MAELQRGYIPRYLNRPPKVLLWDLDLAIVFMVPVWFIGMILKEVVLGLAIGILLAYGFRKFKTGRHPQYLKHIFYWFLPSGMGGIALKSLPSSHKRNFHS